MLRAKWIVAVAAGYLVLGAPVHAQDAKDSGTDADSLDVTITLLPEGATQPDAVMKTIALPKLPASAASHAGQATPQGFEKANQRQDRRAQGLATAEEARAQGSELGQEMRQQAAEQRENAERGKPSDTPGNGPSSPSLPGHANPPPTTPPTSTPPSTTPPSVNPPTPPSH